MIVAKKDIPSFLDSLKQNYKVYAPVKQDDYVVFKTILDGSEVVLDYANSKIPPKGIMFPQSEKLFTFKIDGKDTKLEETVENGKNLVFGIRPCDTKSISLLDNVFNNDQYRDPYYFAKRENTVLVGIGCNTPETTCFCTSLNGGPFDTNSLDLLLIDLGDKYLVEVVTDKGKDLLATAAYSEATDADKDAASKAKEAATLSSRVAMDNLKQTLDKNFEDEIWNTIHEKCIGCGTCTYVCPTCHCFDIVVDAKDNQGANVRNWDSCMFPLFTMHGSGHNPRPSGKERFRNRIMHKFKYFIDRFDATACVGCGRCIKDCPVNVDIRMVLAEIQEAEGGTES